MNAREANDLAELLDRINELLSEFMGAPEERQYAIRVELEEAKERLKRIALSFQN